MRKAAVATVATLFALCLAVSPAYADHGRDRDWHHDRDEHHDRHSGWVGLAIVGAIAGLALMADRDRPRRAEPVYVAPPPPPPIAVPAPAPPGTWYYCASSSMYYPDTRVCPEGWQAVPASPY